MLTVFGLHFFNHSVYSKISLENLAKLHNNTIGAVPKSTASISDHFSCIIKNGLFSGTRLVIVLKQTPN